MKKPRYSNPANQARVYARELDGLVVSVDVSTGDADHGARVFGRVYGAQPEGGRSVTLLAEVVEDTHRPDPLRAELEAIANLAYRGGGDPKAALTEIHRRARKALDQKG